MKLKMYRLFIALLTIIILDLGGGLAYADINSGLVAHWPLDGNANDVIGGNNGNEYGDINYVGGILGQAASFNGFSDYISVPHSTSLTINGPITISSWIKTAGNPSYWNWSGIVNKKANYILTEYFEFRHDGYLAATSRTGQYGSSLNYDYPIRYTYNASETYLTDDRWHHVLSVYDGVMLKIYVDGKPDVSNIVVNTGRGIWDQFTSYDEDVTPYPWGSFSDPSHFWSGIGDAPLLIGMEPIGMESNSGFPGDMYFSGLIDEVRIYNRALLDFEVEELYNQAVFDSDNDDIPDDIDICPFDPDNDADGDGVCATPENNFNFKGTFYFTITGTQPSGCTESGTITIGSDFKQQTNSIYYYYIPFSGTSANYSFIEQINFEKFPYDQEYNRIARIILLSGNTLQVEETGDCLNIASPCWTDDFTINFDGDYNGGNITGERHKEDPLLCQGVITGSITREGVIDNNGGDNDSGGGGGSCFISASAYEFRIHK